MKIRCTTNKADHINVNMRRYIKPMLESIAEHINHRADYSNPILVSTDNGKLDLTKAVGTLSKASVDNNMLAVEGVVFDGKADVVKGSKMAPSGYGKVENGVVTEFTISHMFLTLEHADEHATEIEFLEDAS